MSKRFRRQSGRDRSALVTPVVTAQQRTYEYILPGDEHQVMVAAMATATITVAREPTLSLEDIEVRASADCELLRKMAAAHGCALVNDEDAFSQEFLPHYKRCYLEHQATYQADLKYYERDAHALQDVAWLEAYHALRIHFHALSTSIEEIEASVRAQIRAEMVQQTQG